MVIQKTVIDVHETGVEAAAATAILMGRSAPGLPLEDPLSIMCDHPFQFFVYDKTEDLVLFEGRLGAPAIPGTKPTVPILDLMHSEGDFWSKTFYVDPVDPTASWLESTAIKSSSIRSYLSTKKTFSFIIGALLALVLGLML